MGLLGPLDLRSIFVVNFAGSVEIFSFMAIIFVGVLCGYFNIGNKIAMVLFGLFAVIMASYLPGIYVLVMIITSFATFYSIKKIVS